MRKGKEQNGVRERHFQQGTKKRMMTDLLVKIMQEGSPPKNHYFLITGKITPDNHKL